MTVVLEWDEDAALRQLEKRARRAYLGAFSADITDDARTLMLHWDYGDTTYVDLQALLVAYMEKHGIMDTK